MDEKVYSTRDLTLAATLTTLKFPLLGTDMQIEGSKGQAVGYFRFEDSKDLQDACVKYMQGLISVEPQTMMTNVRTLKAHVQNLIRNPIQ
jgi:hypothetical protein